MRVTPGKLVISTSLSAALALSGATDSKKKALPKAGITTPGIQISMAELTPEAAIDLPAAPELLLSADAVYAASPAKPGIVRVDPKKNNSEVVEGIAKPCGAMISAFGSLWLGDCSDNTLARFDAKTKKLTAKVPIAIATAGSVMAATGDSIWVLVDTKSTLVRIDPETNKPVAELVLPEGCNSVIFGENALWVTSPKNDKILKINPATNLVDKRIEVEGRPIGVTAGEGSIWVLSSREGKVARIDPKTDKITTTIELKIPELNGTVSFGEGYVWVSAAGFPLTRIDPASDKVAQQFTGGPGQLIVASSGAVWLADPSATTLRKIDVKRIKATLAP